MTMAFSGQGEVTGSEAGGEEEGGQVVVGFWSLLDL